VSLEDFKCGEYIIENTFPADWNKQQITDIVFPEINRSLSKWLLGCAISPYILALSFLLCASSLFNSSRTAFCCVFFPLRSILCSTAVPVCTNGSSLLHLYAYKICQLALP
jgi:hypothetical protein